MGIALISQIDERAKRLFLATYQENTLFTVRFHPEKIDFNRHVSFLCYFLWRYVRF